jgi:hypothetical protein
MFKALDPIPRTTKTKNKQAKIPPKKPHFIN